MVGTLWEEGKTDGCCDALVNEASARWNQEDESVDDITVIVIFFNK